MEKRIEILDGVKVSVENDKVKVEANGKVLEREFSFENLKPSVEGNEFVIAWEKDCRKNSKFAGTIAAHVGNLIKGVGEGFVYKLEIANVHFPMNVKVEGSKVVIKSFLGEKTSREANILPGVEVSIKGNAVEVKGSEIEKTGQTAANIEKASKIRNRDRRIFQDGIFMVEKPGRVI